ncbi:N-acetylmuramic acid 6-phosphate etherase [Saccharibacillus sp. CPCC 101409]|uniref:N-acetylmuramic acid 6-phosphate etherase n=1 Tax=Saccharibacillus sp. CPCC 101409 TaxID=3058041 RepID=UPI0026737576|nr:N-acetylmuramic acid 6-phosphate etherase [Saccharibacillus sp. CPCC 101409]MDO3411972.1 N-acetylmuramic acid 6-phosphate etherase [Saccharibacillus sp. CPCC 101409]
MLDRLSTEQRNERTRELDTLPIRGVLELMQEEDAKVPQAIKKKLPEIERAVEGAIRSFRQGGRLIYAGAGTSGRMGILDAVECVPTFGTGPDMVQGVIAGGETAIRLAVEGAEDSLELGRGDMERLAVNAADTVIGIAASGRTPYVIGALEAAREAGAYTIAFSCNKESEIARHADHAIEIETGSEILTGSTRLKAGTAQKLVLNMISTASMIGIGKVYSNLMVDVRPTNVKLEARACAMIAELAGCDEDTAARYYEASGHRVKHAVVMLLLGLSAEEADRKLEESGGFIRRALQ